MIRGNGGRIVLMNVDFLLVSKNSCRELVVRGRNVLRGRTKVVFGQYILRLMF